MSKITATCIKNPFQPRVEENRETREFDFQNQRIRDIFCDFYPLPSPDTRIVASVNGKMYEDADWDMGLEPGDNLVFVPVPQGSGGGGSNPLAMVAMIAVAIVAAVVTAGVGSMMMSGAFMGSGMITTGLSTSAMMAGAMAGAAVMVGGGLLVSAIFPTPKIGGGAGDLSDSSPTYGWSTFNNATQEGTLLPVIIGERRVTPPLIAAHTEVHDGESFLYLLYAVSEGPIESIYGVELDEQPVSYYSEVGVATRLGSDIQTAIPYFNDTYADAAVSSTLNKAAYIVRETSGDGIDGIQIHLSLPYGLWYANDKGKLDEQEMVFSIQYRKVGDSNWITYYPLEDNDGWEEHELNKVYNPGEIVFKNGAYYRCTHYFAKVKVYEGNNDDSGPAQSFVGYADQYVESTKRIGLMGSSVVEVYDTPDVTNANCWERYYPGAKSLTLKGNSNSQINRSFRINFNTRGKYQVQIKVLSGPPEDNARYGAKAIWAGLSEIIKDDFTYPGTALLGLRVKATDQLSGGIPRVTCVAKKTKHTFPLAGTVSLTNPAWANYYALNNEVWGGGVPESKIILSEFQSWASYCSSKGLACCLYIDQRMTYTALKNYLCELGRGNVVQYGTKFGAIVDKPGVASQMFTVGNIRKGTFKMNYLPVDDRANCIRVNYYDKEKNWEKQTVEIRTNEFITGEREKSQEVTLYACDRKELAARHAKLLLNYNKHLLRTCMFDVFIDALACTVGDIILVQHDATRYGLAGGRVAENVSASTPRLLKLDRKVALQAGVTYGVKIRNDNNDSLGTYEFTVPTNGDYTQITTTADMSPLPQEFNIYSLGEKTKEAKPFRIIAITRGEEFTRKVTALEYYDEVYDDTQIVDDTPDYIAAPVVSGLDVVEVIDNVYSKFSKVRLVWNCHGSRGVRVSYEYTLSGTKVAKTLGATQEQTAIVGNLPINVPIKFKVTPVNNSGGFAVKTITLIAESDAVYENGCYESEVFASDELQSKFGDKRPYTLWMQEPQTVSMTFVV